MRLSIWKTVVAIWANSKGRDILGHMSSFTYLFIYLFIFALKVLRTHFRDPIMDLLDILCDGRYSSKLLFSVPPFHYLQVKVMDLEFLLKK